MTKRATSYCVVGFTVGITMVGVLAQDAASRLTRRVGEASGTFAPAGPPLQPPARTDAGESCIVDIVQRYTVSGTLSGTAEINYRILAGGPCGSAAGTFDEEWIAYGTFQGTVKGMAGSGKLSYTARVRAGGDVEGRIVLGQGLDGELSVRGNFGDGRLLYTGHITTEPTGQD